MDGPPAKKSVIFCLKIFFLTLNFQDEGHLYVNYLFHILIS